MFNGEEKKHISDEIGEEYKDWKKTDIILIHSQTGSGKSHFILHKLLPYCVQNKKKILYLVNRNILKKQLIEEIHSEVEIKYNNFFVGTIHSINDYIHVSTYQYIENIILLENHKDIDKFISQFYICVYDECHYFYSDSLYNTYTELSFDYLRKMFNDKIQIFISATIDNIIPIIQNRYPVYTRGSDSRFAVTRYKPIKDRFSYYMNFFRYIEYPKSKIDNNYDYINIKIFKNIEDLKVLVINDICNTDDKWLIFIDSINSGEKLCKEFKDTFKEEKFKNKVIFIDAQYKYQEESRTEINEISKNQKMTKQVIITTPVMDNGISIHDDELKNMVIMCDTKEEFIQMLGRKRIKNDKLNLFILTRDKIYFKKRLLKIEQIYNFYLKHYKNISKMYTYDFPVEPSSDLFDTVELSPIYCWQNCIQLNTVYQNDILKDILRPSYFNEQEKICYTLNGHIAFNSFSVNKCKNLISFYKNIIKRLEEDSNAFIIEQQRWLGIPDEKINLSVYNFEQEIRQKIKSSIEPMLDKEFFEEDNKNFKSDIKDNLLILIDNINNNYIEKCKRYLKDSKRALSDKTFNYIMEVLDFPYRMTKPTGSSYKIILNET